jgi:predicted transglutaminase-like cysteine proteinase
MRVVISVLAAVVLGAGLSACATDGIPAATALVDGAATAPPAGWTSYCARHQEDAGCR